MSGLCFRNIPIASHCRIGHEVYRESPPSNPSEFMDNHTWFNKGVTRWLDIALYKVG